MGSRSTAETQWNLRRSSFAGGGGKDGSVETSLTQGSSSFLGVHIVSVTSSETAWDFQGDICLLGTETQCPECDAVNQSPRTKEDVFLNGAHRNGETQGGRAAFCIFEEYTHNFPLHSFSLNNVLCALKLSPPIPFEVSISSGL